MNRFRLAAVWRLAVVAVCSLTITFLSGTSVWTAARSMGVRAVERVVRTVAPSYAATSAAPPAPSISASMTAAVATDTDGDGKADPGDVVRYTTTITNSGDAPATGVHLLDTPDAHTTFAGTFHISPLAANDTYTSVGNMTLDTTTLAGCGTNVLYSVACNDTLNGATLTKFGDTLANAGNVTVNGTNTVSTIKGGTVKLNADGAFVYDPAAGFEGDDEFYYTLGNSSVATLTDVGKVTITVGGTGSGVNQMVWFVNSTGPAGNGTQKSPFNSLGAFTAVNNAGGSNPTFGDTIYLFENAAPYIGPMTVFQNQRLIGQDATVSPSALNGPAPRAGNAYPANNPSGTTVSIASSAGSPTISLQAGTTLAGFTVGHTSGNFAISNGGGALSVREVAINSPGGAALSLSGTAVTNNATFTGFTSVSSSGGTNAVKLFGASGVLALGTGALSGTSGAAVSVAGSAIAVSYAGSITSSAASALDVVTLSSVHDTSSLTFSGAINASNVVGMQFNDADGSYTFSGVVTMTGGAQVSLFNTCDGSFSFTNGGTSITNPGGAAFTVNGGTGSIDYNGSISKTNDGLAIDIQSKTGGTVSFDGTVSSTSLSDGIRLLNNTGATFAFTGTLTLNTSASGTTGFSATGGGTVAATGGGSTINSGAGTALNITNTTIAATGLTFRSVSANGAANGIVLNNTGSSGGLTVTGNGGSCTSAATCTGGAIQNATVAVSLASTRAVSIDRLFVQNTSDSGIKGTTVTDFTLTNSRIDNSGTALGAETANVAFNATASGTENNLAGTVTITGNTLTNAYYHGIDIFNFNGTITGANISNNAITSSNQGGIAIACGSTPSTCSKGSGIRFIAFGSATTVAKVTRATIAGNVVANFPAAAGIMVQGGNGNGGSGAGFPGELGTANDAARVVAIAGNTVHGFSATNRIGTQGIIAVVNGYGTGNFDISGNNQVSNTLGNAIAVSSFGFATVSATISNNVTIANNQSAAASIGAGTSQTFGSAAETPTLTVAISNNTVSQSDGNGILVTARDASGQVNATIKNNTVAAPLSGLRNGIRVDAGNAVSLDDNVCLDIVGNTTAGTGHTNAGIGLRKQGTSSTTNAFAIQGTAATSSPGVEQFVGNGPAGIRVRRTVRPAMAASTACC